MNRQPSVGKRAQRRLRNERKAMGAILMVSNERVRKAEIRAERRMRNTDPNTDISPPLGRSFRLYTPGPEKYPGQRKRFLRHCWPGDGVPSRMATKAARNDRREARKAEREQGTTAPAAG